MINELELIDNIGLLRSHTLVFYGAGKEGERMIRKVRDSGIIVHFICDSNMEKWGQFVEGVKIISPTRLKQLDYENELVVIITVKHMSIVGRIASFLESLNLRTHHIATLCGLGMALYQNVPPCDDTLLERWKKMEETYLKRQYWRLDHISHLMMANNILVYQPGKVGSQTVSRSLLMAGVTESFLSGHLHTLNYSEMEVAIKEAIAQKLESLWEIGTIKIITLVREPISRDLAFIFETMVGYDVEIPFFTGSFIELCSKRLEKIAFGGDYLFGRPSEKYGFQFEWFDNELKSVFGIDVFEHQFDRKRGYSIIKQGNTEVLILKLEKLDSLGKVVGDFVETPDFRLFNYNEGNDRQSKYLYANVKAAIKIPPEVVSLYYQNNPRMDYFYTEEEKAAFLNKWKKNIKYDQTVSD